MNFGKSTYQTIFAPYANQTVGYLRLFGNWGDHLIEAATMELFKDFNIQVRLVNPSVKIYDQNVLTQVETIFIAGGGNLGNKYNENLILRTELCKHFKKNIVILPQSMTDDGDKNRYSMVWLREGESFNKWPEPKGACHDLAFYMNLDSFKTITPKFKTGILCRDDAEAKGVMHFNLGDPVKLSQSLNEYISLAANFETIITDRLHFAIIGAKLGRRVHFLAGNYHKNKSVFEFSLRLFPNVSFHEDLKAISS